MGRGPPASQGGSPPGTACALPGAGLPGLSRPRLCCCSGGWPDARIAGTRSAGRHGAGAQTRRSGEHGIETLRVQPPAGMVRRDHSGLYEHRTIPHSLLGEAAACPLRGGRVLISGGQRGPVIGRHSNIPCTPAHGSWKYSQGLFPSLRDPASWPLSRRLRGGRPSDTPSPGPPR